MAIVIERGPHRGVSEGQEPFSECNGFYQLLLYLPAYFRYQNRTAGRFLVRTAEMSLWPGRTVAVFHKRPATKSHRRNVAKFHRSSAVRLDWFSANILLIWYLQVPHESCRDVPRQQCEQRARQVEKTVCDNSYHWYLNLKTTTIKLFNRSCDFWIFLLLLMKFMLKLYQYFE